MGKNHPIGGGENLLGVPRSLSGIVVKHGAGVLVHRENSDPV